MRGGLFPCLIAIATVVGCSNGGFEIASSEPVFDAAPEGASDVSADSGSAQDFGVDAESRDTCVPNGCGGCTELANKEGDPCGVCGAYVCADTETLSCNDHPKNDCGGCTALGGKPGDVCASCGGTLRCDGIDALTCNSSGPKNACGGCSTLSAAPGAPCGTCGGKFACVGTDAVSCAGSKPLNDCGGCTRLTGKKGDACGDCGGGTLACTGTDALICVGATPRNACGGCTVLASPPGSRCAGCSTFACAADKNSVICAHDCVGTQTCCDLGSASRDHCYDPACLSCCTLP